MDLKRIEFRIKQFFRALLSRFTEEDNAFVREYLNLEEYALFEKLPIYEKKHSVMLAQKMLEVVHGSKEIDERDMVKFALLHDIGKATIKFTLLDKAMLVIIRRLFPFIYDKMAESGKESPTHTSRKFYVHKYHGKIGADLLRKIGDDEKIIKAVEVHHKKPEPDDAIELILLRQLDDKS